MLRNEISASFFPGAFIFCRGEVDSAFACLEFLYVETICYGNFKEKNMTDFKIQTHSVCQCYHFVLLYAQK